MGFVTMQRDQFGRVVSRTVAKEVSLDTVHPPAPPFGADHLLHEAILKYVRRTEPVIKVRNERIKIGRVFTGNDEVLRGHSVTAEVFG